MKTLTIEQSYKAMFLFLEYYYQLTHADDIGALLGSMQLLHDGKPADAAMWEEWIDVCKSVLNQEIK